MTHHADSSPGDPATLDSASATPVDPQTVGPKTMKKKKKRYISVAKAWTGAIALALITGAATGGVAELIQRSSEPSSPPVAEPTPIVAPEVHIASTAWVPPPADQADQTVERYSISGTATNLVAGQVLWTFNQAIDSNGNVAAIYPDPGPCGPDENHQFTCALGVADAPSPDPDHPVKNYNVIVVIETTKQAYAFAEQKAGFQTLIGYPSLDAIPHVSGEHTADSKLVVKP